VFAILFGLSVVLLRTSIADAPLGATEWSSAARTRLRAALTLMPFAGIAFLWFVGVVRDRMGAQEDRFFATVYLGSGLLFLAMMFVSMALAGAILRSAESQVTPSSPPDVVAFGRAVMLQVTNVYALRMAGVFMVSLSTAWHRSGTAPRWLVMSTYLVAAVLLVATNLSMWIALVFPGWVLLVSVYVLVTARRS
jgi:hypothetical protein